MQPARPRALLLEPVHEYLMEKIIIGFIVAVVLLSLFSRYLLKEDQVALVDTQDAAHRETRYRFVLPPSGYKPGHLLRSTIKNQKLQTPPYIDLGIYAYHQYLIAPKVIRDRIATNLAETIVGLDEWLAWLEAADIEFLCIGESHQENYREFLAEQFFTRYRVDRLFLETTRHSLPVVMLRTQVGDPHVSLLRADISEIIRAAKQTNPDLLVLGGEESWGQQSRRRARGGGLRDRSIMENIVNNYVPGRRHAGLFGALHCTHHRNWLYSRLNEPDSPLAGSTMLNISVMSKQKELLTRSFNGFLQSVGFESDVYVISDTAKLDPLIHAWFFGLTRNFTHYTTVVLFR
ncbi:MAG: hypothetical protein OEU36_02075 [Gammaproteobacteria bacterium]|nr:hypothetical protein [Gammaproteobacteria bacterium]